MVEFVGFECIVLPVCVVRCFVDFSLLRGFGDALVGVIGDVGVFGGFCFVGLL